MVRLYQVELEHYEKIEGTTLTLDGKANRLATMIRGNLGAAMQGLAVVPLFAGYDLDAADPAQRGRIYSFDVTGGRYPEQYYHVGRLRLAVRQGLAEEAMEPGLTATTSSAWSVEALYDAADDDSATGGPDLTRRHLPGRHAGHRRGHRRVDRRRARRRSCGRDRSPTAKPDAGRRNRRDGRRRSHVDAVLRLGRADHARPLGVRPQGHRPRPQRRRADLRRRRAVRRRERQLRAAQGQRDLRPHRRSPRSASTTSSRICASPASGSPTCAATPTTAATSPRRALANAYAQTLGTIFTEQQKPYEVEICVAEVGAAPSTTSSTGSPTTARSSTSRSSW